MGGAFHAPYSSPKCPHPNPLPEGEGTEMDRLPEGNATADGQPLFRFPLAFYNGPFDRTEPLQGLQFMTKHIFVTGGVVSSLGKGLTSASIGMLLEQRGLSVRMQKLDPYINVDPGTMSPYQHGEVYVLDDGSETDLDLGHYERFTNSPLNRALELHHRPDLSVGDRKGAAGRVPGPDRPGHPAHHQRDQGGTEQAGRRRMSTWSSPRSAAPSATSKASRSSKPSASSRSTWARKTASTST